MDYVTRIKLEALEIPTMRMLNDAHILLKYLLDLNMLLYFIYNRNILIEFSINDLEKYYFILSYFVNMQLLKFNKLTY